jgi:hypothetical protein
MKKLIKIFSLLFIMACTISCEDNNDDLKFEPQPEIGWIQFVEGEPALINSNIVDQETISIGVNIQVPTTSSDLTINYDLVSVSGMDPNTAFSNVGSIISPAGQTSYMGPDNRTGRNYVFLPTIDLNVSDIATELTEPMVFDIVLTGTSSSRITAGLSGENFPLTQRVQIWSSAHFAGTYDVSEQFTGPPNAPFGLSDFFGESYQVELTSVPGDSSKYTIANSSGFDTYFIDGAEVTLLSDGSVFFEDGFSTEGFPVVALFRIFGFDTSSYDAFSITCSGPLDTFGAYQFVITKQ